MKQIRILRVIVPFTQMIELFLKWVTYNAHHVHNN